MELVQDLVWTASVALILSFFVAKLVAMAMADREPESPEFKVSESSGGDGEVRFEEKLKVEEVYQSQMKVQFAAEVREVVDRFEAKPTAVEFEKKSDDGEKMSVEKAIDSDRQRGEEVEEITENRQVEDLGAQSAPNDVVTAHCGEEKGKGEAVEVKVGNYSDEDDWEGIEKSELDEGYTATMKPEGG